jgi:hypothetical protein
MANKYKQENLEGTAYSDGQYWFGERDVCRHCSDEREAAGLPYRFADEQFSFGVYAGRYCEVCWPQSGFRDATDSEAQFDPADAGEVMEAEDY